MADIQKIDIIKNNKLKSESLIFRVANGEGKLRSEIVSDENGLDRECLFLCDIPVIMYDKEYSDFCAIKVQIAEGREGIDDEIIEALEVMNSVKGLEDGFEKLKNIFSLLEDGYYMLNDSKMIPTDGDGNFFWCVDGAGKNYENINKFYEKKDEVISPYEKILIPSQSLNLYNREKVNDYRERINKGEKKYILALGLTNFHSILIDGHHKASAAFLEGVHVNCLSISPCSLYKGKYLNFGNFNNFKNNNKSIVFSGVKCKEININKKKFYHKVQDVKSELINRKNE